jgi:hypothetical protein
MKFTGKPILVPVKTASNCYSCSQGFGWFKRPHNWCASDDFSRWKWDPRNWFSNAYVLTAMVVVKYSVMHVQMIGSFFLVRFSFLSGFGVCATICFFSSFGFR